MVKKIRVGMINCDLHAMYYSALMEEYDPVVLRDDEIGRGHAAHFYLYMDYQDPRKITAPRVDGFEIVKVWDRDINFSKNISRIFNSSPEVCKTFEEVSDDVDLVFIADCNGDGSDHLELSSPGIYKKVPTFIDKPLAYKYKDAQKIVELAKKHKTPVLSRSMLSVLPQAEKFRNRFNELGSPEFAVIKGGGDTMAGHIHVISLAQFLFGTGVRAVECMGETPLAYVHLDYGGKPDRPEAGVVINCASGGTYHCSLYVSVYSSLGAIHSPGFGDFEFPYGAAEILKMTKKMVRTGEPQVSYGDMLEGIAIADAARLAQKTGKKVFIKDIYKPENL